MVQQVLTLSQGWEHFPHNGEIGIHAYGATPAQAFAQAGCAVTATITREKVGTRHRVDIQLEAPDIERLLVAWIKALLKEMSDRRVLFSRFDVTIANNILSGTAWGEALNEKRHKPAISLANTWPIDAQVRESAGHWHIRCVLDAA